MLVSFVFTIGYGPGYRVYLKNYGDQIIILLCGGTKKTQKKDIQTAKELGVVARAKGMKNIAKETGLSREQLYRSLSDQGNPTLKTIILVMNSLGLDIMTKLHT